MANFKIDMSKNSKELSNLYPTLSDEELEAIRVVYDSGTWNSGLWVRWRAVEYLLAEIIKLEREKGGNNNGEL